MKTLKEFRAQSGETQTDFAFRAGIPQQAISDLETGRKGTSPERLARVLRAAMLLKPPAQATEVTRSFDEIIEEAAVIRRLLHAVVMELEAGGELQLLRQTAEAAIGRQVEIRDEVLRRVREGKP